MRHIYRLGMSLACLLFVTAIILALRSTASDPVPSYVPVAPALFSVAWSWRLFLGLVPFALLATWMGGIVAAYLFVRDVGEARKRHAPVPQHQSLTYAPKEYIARQPPALPPPVQDVTPPLPTPRAFDDWFPALVAQDRHLLLVGGTGEGKSSLLRALARARARTDRLIIIDTHAKYAGWGITPIGIGRDFVAVEHALHALYAEFNRRFQPEEPDGDPLTVFIDEYNSLSDHLPIVKQYFREFICEARKSGIRFVFSSTEYNVKALGIEGRSDVRTSMWQVFLGSFAVARLKATAAAAWPTVLQAFGGAPTWIDRTGMPLDLPDLDPAVLWVFPSAEQDREHEQVADHPIPDWTPEHLAVARLLVDDPQMSQRALARQLWPDRVISGHVVQRAGRLAADVRSVPQALTLHHGERSPTPAGTPKQTNTRDPISAPPHWLRARKEVA